MHTNETGVRQQQLYSVGEGYKEGRPDMTAKVKEDRGRCTYK